ncbi:MAG: GspE/PulE family protein [Desulfotomaculaceae bacterium]|nr:GspE/PulE family protein [Desulfotomaculaceae bacterium]MDD4767400.1 GspE/PulE family protein [Desulfotomaculaceae bacterium]
MNAKMASGAVLSDLPGYKDLLPADKIDLNLLSLIPEHLIRRYMLIPVKKSGNRLFVAMTEPFNILALDDLRLFTGYDIEPLAAGKKEIKMLIEKHCGTPEVEMVMQDLGIEPERGEPAEIPEAEFIDQAPVIRLVNLILTRAIDEEASDIHIEPFEQFVRIRYRIDGLLSEAMNLPHKMIFPVVSRIKVMANLDIAERRLPQDGRIPLKLHGSDIDLRISTMPTMFGEKVVIRVLNKGNVKKFNLAQLGLTKYNLKRFLSFIRASHGMLLVTGPTGSGKTTTLYTALNEINTIDKNIITVEDPVEYTLANINQTQVNEKAGITFANYLRSILRQDPDIIMIGEIRDPQTAEIAVQAAVTGHLVLSTIHTNDAPGAVTRLINMGIAPFMVASSVTGVVAQRLVRRICLHCKQESKPDNKEKAFAGLAPGTSLFAGAGCEICNFTGYKGRIAIYEVMTLSPELQNIILQNVSTEEIKQAAVSAGMVTLKEDGLKKAAAGLTTVKEIMRACLRE